MHLWPQDQEGGVAMLYRLHSPETDPGPNSPSTAGMGDMRNSPLRETGPNVQRRREPARTHQDGGTGHALRRDMAEQTVNSPTLTNQTNGTEAQINNQDQ